MYLFCGKEKIVDQAIYISTNISGRNGAQMNCFKDKIAKTIWQDYISY